MRFENVYIMGLLMLAPVVIGTGLVLFWLKNKQLYRLISPHLEPAVLPSLSRTRKFWKSVLRLVALTGVILCLMRPQYGVELEKSARKTRSVLVACDTSKSMWAQDVPPSRLAHAKEEIWALVQSSQGDAFGLIAFAGDAFLQCPLTVDAGAFQMFLEDLEVGAVSTPGTNLARVIEEAVHIFSKQKMGNKILVLITDGETTDGSDPVAAAQAAAEKGIRIYPIGIGSSNGDPIPDQQGGYKKDAQGQIVLSKLNESVLQQIAQVSGGRYFLSNNQELVADRLYRQLNPPVQGAVSGSFSMHYRDRYQWILCVVLLCLLADTCLSERKQRYKKLNLWKKIGVLLFLWGITTSSEAASISDYGHNNEAIKQYQRQHYTEAKTEWDALQKKTWRPQIAYNLAGSVYKQGQFEQAFSAYAQAAGKLSGVEKSRALYNGGNAAFRQEQYQQAIDAYQKTLRLNPQDKNAKYNLELALLRLKQQKKNQKQPAKPQPKQPDKKGAGSGKSADQQEKANRAKGLLGALEQREKEARQQHKPAPKVQRKVDKDW